GEDPHPRRARHRWPVQRDQRALEAAGRLARRAARLELRDGHPVPEDGLPEEPLDPHLLAVGQPELAVLRGPDADVLAEEVGRPAVLRRPGAPPLARGDRAWPERRYPPLTADRHGCGTRVAQLVRVRRLAPDHD